VLFSELTLENLASRVARELIEEDDLARDLESGEVLPDPDLEVVLAWAGGGDDDERLEPLAEPVVVDPDRGDRGAFCPWPPLYDLALGGVMKIFGDVTWVPPVFFALFVAGVTAAMMRFGTIAAAIAGARGPGTWPASVRRRIARRSRSSRIAITYFRLVPVASRNAAGVKGATPARARARADSSRYVPKAHARSSSRIGRSPTTLG
jgi:hypothetical protein